MEFDKIISKTITINATTSKVWNYLTKPELIKLWMSDAAMEITSDWTTGSKIIFQTTVNGKQKYRERFCGLSLKKFLNILPIAKSLNYQIYQKIIQ
jgi:hypothetical protein